MHLQEQATKWVSNLFFFFNHLQEHLVECLKVSFQRNHRTGFPKPVAALEARIMVQGLAKVLVKKPTCWAVNVYYKTGLVSKFSLIPNTMIIIIKIVLLCIYYLTILINGHITIKTKFLFATKMLPWLPYRFNMMGVEER